MRKTTLLTVILLTTLTPTVWAQSDPVNDEMLKNGFYGAGTYTGNSEYNVNLYNGNLIVAIPLLTLPGRAGHDLHLTMSYNSKQLTREEYSQYGVSYWDGRFFQEGPTSGRWLINSWPTLEYYAGYYCYFTTPDGAVHDLDRFEGPYIYASDGSGLRYNTGLQRMESLDGSYFDFSTAGLVHHVDRNGNRITYQSGNPRTITDTLGRHVLIYLSGVQVGQIVVQNDPTFIEDDLVYQFDYEAKFVHQFLAVIGSCGSPTSFYDYEHRHWHYRHYGVTTWFGIGQSVPVLSNLTLPNGTSYHFTYNDDVISTCPGYPAVTLSTL
ncbi:MAG: hypothetical protein EHM23_04910, partial [Acidobacteria bacterium]